MTVCGGSEESEMENKFLDATGTSEEEEEEEAASMLTCYTAMSFKLAAYALFFYFFTSRVRVREKFREEIQELSFKVNIVKSQVGESLR